MEKKMNIRLGFGCTAALLIAMMFASCTKEEIFSAPVKKSDQINFGVNPKWDDDEVSTRSGVGYGSRAGSFMLRSEDSADSLTVNVYVKNTISESAPMTKGSVVENPDDIADFDVYCSLDNGSETVPYFLNLEATQENGFWKPARDCYWPGSDFTKLKFLAVAPYKHGMTSTIASGSVMPTSFSYTVPEEAVDQNDIMMAVTGEYPGDHNQTVPVTFNHLLSAINVKIGSVPEGTIHSITLKGVGSSSTYTVADGTWATCTATDSFAVDFAGDGDTFATTGTETGNPQINAAEATFMMIPQTLGAESVLEVVFTHTITNNNVTLTASLDKIVWEKSKTYNYLINIEPDFTLSIEEENMSVADCHYDTRMITIKNLYHDVDWVLTSDSDWVKFRIVPDDFETNDNYIDFRNYWVENHVVTIINRIVDTRDNGDANQSSEVTTTNSYPIENIINGSGSLSIQVYFYENLQEVENTRSAIIYLKDSKGNIKDELMVSQYNPIWNNNYAYERIEEDENLYPWGFASARTVKYSYPAIDDVNWGRLQWLWNIIVALKDSIFDLLGWAKAIYNNVIGDALETRKNAYNYFKTNYADIYPDFITLSGSADSDWTATLSYTTTINATSEEGLDNTSTILSFAGGGVSGSDAETWLVQNGLEKESDTGGSDPTTLQQTAAYQAIKKNAFVLTTTITNVTRIMEYKGEAHRQEEQNIATIPSLKNSEIQWFLPSAGEVATLLQTACDSDTSNNDEALSGTYWSSTSDAGTNSICYSAEGATSSASRTTTCKIRAARMKN